MTVGRDHSVVELDGSRLAALTACVSSDRISVERWLMAERPEGVVGDNPEAVGDWIAAEILKAGLSRTRVTLAIPRGDIVLKQMSMPVPVGGVNEGELVGMVRLQMVRQLTMSVEGTAIDYAPL